jgi:hypothetical protein
LHEVPEKAAVLPQVGQLTSDGVCFSNALGPKETEQAGLKVINGANTRGEDQALVQQLVGGLFGLSAINKKVHLVELIQHKVIGVAVDKANLFG